MSPVLTPDEIALGDDLAAETQKVWWWLLAGGIFSVLFGFVVLAYRDVTLYTLAYLAGGYFVASGVFELIASVRMARHRWLYLVMGLLSIGAGIAMFAWPNVTLYIVVVLIGSSLLFWGITDLVNSLASRHVPHWWLYFIRGILAIALAVWAFRHPGSALNILVAVIGLWAILYGVVEMMVAFAARHAVRTWEAMKSENRV